MLNLADFKCQIRCLRSATQIGQCAQNMDTEIVVLCCVPYFLWICSSCERFVENIWCNFATLWVVVEWQKVCQICHLLINFETLTLPWVEPKNWWQPLGSSWLGCFWTKINHEAFDKCCLTSAIVGKQSDRWLQSLRQGGSKGVSSLPLLIRFTSWVFHALKGNIVWLASPIHVTRDTWFFYVVFFFIKSDFQNCQEGVDSCLQAGYDEGPSTWSAQVTLVSCLGFHPTSNQK